MRSYSEIDTIIKRSTKAKGFSWGVAEEIGKNIRQLELFGLPGVKNINQYFKIFSDDKFENCQSFKKNNKPQNYYCPIKLGLSFFDQSISIQELIDVEIEKVAFPLIFLPFISRSSEITGKRIFLKIDKKEFLLNFNLSIYSNYLSSEVVEKADVIKIQFLENKNNFSEDDWKELTNLSENIFVEETEELKQKTAGAGLSDND
ncbi:DUF3726 domain-containing protein [Candidatus Pelagibacter sp.]|jgi:hypothetical protein|nr:DUF3726 domain-containing protein [Candidatus Pelagibacter sp.]|tara:strand:+ start:3453 stop:4061 length:609 start_codon:yes stop_codon:yes gene_type:complete